MAKEISRVGELASEYRIRDLRLERRGYLRVFSFAMDGAPYRMEFMHRGSAVMVLPVDWARGVLYLVEQPRPNMAFAAVPVAVEALSVAATEGRSPAEIVVPGSAIHTVDVPAGMIDGGETPEEAAVRELREETGLVVTPLQLKKVADHYVSAGGTTERHVCFLAYVTKDSPRVVPEGDGTERIVTREFAFAEVADMLKDGSVRHGSLDVLLREVVIMELRRALGARDGSPAL
ncbi:MAG: hypothetical protein RL272_587 [Candidatus Parcubacteria bacterium]